MANTRLVRYIESIGGVASSSELKASGFRRAPSPTRSRQGWRTATTPAGNTVRCYDAERSIADLLKQRKTEGADAQLVQDAVAGYFKRGDKDLPKLATICESLGAREELQVYLEVL